MWDQSNIEVYLNWIDGIHDGRPSIESYLKANGRAFVPQELPERFSKMAWKMCYYNCQNVLLDGRYGDLRYCEGVAISGSLGAPLPVYHSWLIDSADNVIDLTWTKAELGAYFGVSFERSFLKDHVKRYGIGCAILDNPQNSWELVRSQPSPEITNGRAQRPVPGASFSF